MGEKNTSCRKPKLSCVPGVMAACYSFKNGESDYLQGYKGTDLSQAMDCTANVACNKLNPDNEHNTPTLKDAVKLTDHFDDNRILEAWAAERGMLLVPMVEPDSVDEEEILDHVLNLSNFFGGLHSAYHNARADGIIDPEEYKEIKSASLLLRRAAATLEIILQTQVRELPQRKEVIING